jgi:hypothetical protein
MSATDDECRALPPPNFLKKKITKVKKNIYIYIKVNKLKI